MVQLLISTGKITCRRDLSYVANSNECHKELQAEWQFNLTKMFPDTVDCFSPSNNMYILVEEQSKIPFNKKKFRDLLTLDTDFDCTSAVFVGNFYSSEDILRRCFHEEQRIFQKNLIPLVGRLF